MTTAGKSIVGVKRFESIAREGDPNEGKHMLIYDIYLYDQDNSMMTITLHDQAYWDMVL